MLEDDYDLVSETNYLKNEYFYKILKNKSIKFSSSVEIPNLKNTRHFVSFVENR